METLKIKGKELQNTIEREGQTHTDRTVIHTNKTGIDKIQTLIPTESPSRIENLIQTEK